MLSVISAVPGYRLASSGTLFHAIARQILTGFSVGFLWGALPITILVLFPTRLRFSASASNPNLPYMLFGGTAPFVATWLIGKPTARWRPLISLFKDCCLAGRSHHRTVDQRDLQLFACPRRGYSLMLFLFEMIRCSIVDHNEMK